VPLAPKGERTNKRVMNPRKSRTKTLNQSADGGGVGLGGEGKENERATGRVREVEGRSEGLGDDEGEVREPDVLILRGSPVCFMSTEE